MSFDFGAEIPERGPCYKRWPEEGKFTALIDGDMIPYIVGYTAEEAKAVVASSRVAALLGEDFDRSSLAWYKAMREQPEFQDACDQADWIVNDWADMAKADSAILFMTDSESNYRLRLAFTAPYKGQRKEEKPPFFYELRRHLLEMHGARMSSGCEADDDLSKEQWRRHRLLEVDGVEVGSEQHKQFSDCCIVSKDKDLFMIPGWHVDPVNGQLQWVDVLGWLEPVWKDKETIKWEQWPLVDGSPVHPDEVEGLGMQPDVWTRGEKKGEVKTKRVNAGKIVTQYIDKLRGAGLKFFYAQLLMGDGVDNYPGIPGIGGTGAFEALDGCSSERELFEKVRSLYREKYGEGTHLAENHRGGTCELTAYQRMLEQGRLAWMQTFDGEIWRDKHYCPTGECPVWESLEACA